MEGKTPSRGGAGWLRRESESADEAEPSALVFGEVSPHCGGCEVPVVAWSGRSKVRGCFGFRVGAFSIWRAFAAANGERVSRLSGRGVFDLAGVDGSQE
jgi:hypothetical protein